MSPTIRHVLLTGNPGVGKTTLTNKICNTLMERGITVTGFYTVEVRVQDRRIGFDVVSVPDGERRPLARTLVKGEVAKGSKMVGQYAVDIASFESIAIPVISAYKGNGVLVVDEVGKMELFSTQFPRALERALELQTCTLLATIPVQRRPIPIVDNLRARKDALVMSVDRSNRNDPKFCENIISILTGA